MNKALFLDRDNTIIFDAPYMADPEKVKIMPGVVEALCEFRKSGFLLIVITNQSGIGRGCFSAEQMHAVNNRMLELFAAGKIVFDDILFCPHAPDDGCSCRKPEPGMLFEAAEKNNIDLGASIMIGDKASDVEAGIAAGCGYNIWLSHGRGKMEINTKNCLVAEDLADAVKLLLKNK